MKTQEFLRAEAILKLITITPEAISELFRHIEHPDRALNILLGIPDPVEDMIGKEIEEINPNAIKTILLNYNRLSGKAHYEYICIKKYKIFKGEEWTYKPNSLSEDDWDAMEWLEKEVTHHDWTRENYAPKLKL